ncbi:hypothetical protein [Streptomyces sp. NPDC058108]|uniref:hypothetical protein n=1 Tax=Streptomyces sp. NPDC058108 TaxID=3346344 RepID=UPI0036E27EA6
MVAFGGEVECDAGFASELFSELVLVEGGQLGGDDADQGTEPGDQLVDLDFEGGQQGVEAAGLVPQGRPSLGYQSAKSSSHHSPSSRSRTHIAVVPRGLFSRATCAVRGGTRSPERGRRDNGHLDSCIGRRNHPSMPVNHAAAPGNYKIPDRAKVRRPFYH